MNQIEIDEVIQCDPDPIEFRGMLEDWERSLE